MFLFKCNFKSIWKERNKTVYIILINEGSNESTLLTKRIIGIKNHK